MADNPGEPLYLTPLIKAGEISKAQEAARVSDPVFNPVVSYSGYMTVDEKHDSNIFFWYFPAETSYDNKGDENIPVILWSDGGPGMSCVYSIFTDSGPFMGKINDGMNFTLNPISWHKKYHMIFMDNPVESGFSHTKSEGGYVTTIEQVAQFTYEFITQFFKMFPHLQKNPFYDTGVSYGGAYAAHIAHYIHERNLKNPEVFINLTGVIMDSPFIDAYTQTVFGELMYTAGILSKKVRDEYLQEEERFRRLLNEGNWAEAFALWWDFARGKTPAITGYQALYNFVDDVSREGMVNMTEFMTLNSTRRALHVGDVKFQFLNMEQINRMRESFMKTSAPKLDEVLKNGYKFLMFIGNTDVITGHLGIRNLFETLTWEGKEEYIDGDRTIWKVGGRVAGYITKSGKATLVMMRNAGHGCYIDQPTWVLEAVADFIK